MHKCVKFLKLDLKYFFDNNMDNSKNSLFLEDKNENRIEFKPKYIDNKYKDSFIIYKSDNPDREIIKKKLYNYFFKLPDNREIKIDKISRKTTDLDNILNIYMLLIQTRRLSNSKNIFSELKKIDNYLIGGGIPEISIHRILLKNQPKIKDKLFNSLFFELFFPDFNNNQKYFYFVKLDFINKIPNTIVKIPYIVRIDENIYNYMKSEIFRILKSDYFKNLSKNILLNHKTLINEFNNSTNY